MVERIIQHKHCSICGKAIPAEEEYCSENCKERFEAIQKKKKNLMYIMYGLMFFLLILLFFG